MTRPNTESSSLVWARFFIIYIGGVYIAIKLTHMAASLIEYAIDTFPEMSYLNLNKGDEKLIEQSKADKPKAYFRLILGAIGTIALGIVASRLEKFV